MRAAAAVAAVALLVLGAGAGAAEASVYVSLGDSLARGWQPDPSGHSHATDAGYVDGVARSLAGSHRALTTVKLGCPGETAESMLAGGHCRYAKGSQLAQAEAVLAANAGHVAAVTVNIGDNDVERCIHRSGVDEACVTRELAVVRRVPRRGDRRPTRPARSPPPSSTAA